MILGIGVDSIEISRVVKAMEKEHLSIAFLRKRNGRRWNTQKGEVLLILPGKKR